MKGQQGGREREGGREEQRRRERLTHVVLAPDRILLPGFNKAVSPHPSQINKHLYSTSFKMKATKVKEMYKQERKGRHG